MDWVLETRKLVYFFIIGYFVKCDNGVYVGECAFFSCMQKYLDVEHITPTILFKIAQEKYLDESNTAKC